MYLHNIPAVENIDLWSIPLEKRLKTLEAGHRRVAYIYLLPDDYVFRYRVYNMVQALQASVDGTSAAYFTHHDLASMDRVVDIADIIVVCRTKYDQELNRLITRARLRGKIVYFDVDDLVFDVNYIHLILNTHNLDRNDPVTWDNWFAHIGRISATMQLCDRAIATNAYLAAHLQPYFKEKVSVIPNFLNREQMGISEQIYKAKKASGFARSDRIHLGYFSGTPSHDRDFNVAADALAQMMELHPQIVLRIVGHMNISGSLQNYPSQIEHYPLQNFVNLQRLIGQVEVNLVPLQDNEFTNCKSELKYFEAGIVGTISIATPIFSYARAIQDGMNGFLARSFEWAEKLQTCLDSFKSPAAVEMAENAMLQSEQHYAWYNQTRVIEDTLFSESENSPASNYVKVHPLQLRVKLEELTDMDDEKHLNPVDVLVLMEKKYNQLQGEMKEQELVLRSLEAELLEIHGSRAWKVINIYRKVHLWLIPRGSVPEMVMKFFKGLILHPGETIKKAVNTIKRILFEPKRRVMRLQNKLIKQYLPKDVPRLIVFLVPGVNVINGGTMSICSLAKVSISLKPIHNSEVLIATLPGSNTLFTKYTYFENPFDIYRFEQLYSYFTKIEELTLHLPEAFVTQFLFCLSSAEREFLRNIPKLTINILNQNVWLMPSREIVDQVKQLTEAVTCTTAHSKYCTREMRNYYRVPFHNFSASNLTNYYYTPYEDKENLMIISHDDHESKGKILAKIELEHPEIKIIRIWNIPYEKYKRLLSLAKWAITFGEGLDGYFMESIRSGAIPFAVYNKDFFSDRFKNLPNVYLSYEEMYDNLSDDLSKLGEPNCFKSLSARLIEIDKQEYDDEKYKDNISRYYLGDYDLP